MRRSRRCAVKADCVTLIDAEIGPRHAPLGKAAWETLDGLSAAASGERLSLCKRDGTPDTNRLYHFWPLAMLRFRMGCGLLRARRW